MCVPERLVCARFERARAKKTTDRRKKQLCRDGKAKKRDGNGSKRRPVDSVSLNRRRHRSPYHRRVSFAGEGSRDCRSEKERSSKLSQQPTNWSQHLLHPRNLRVSLATTLATQGRNNEDQPASPPFLRSRGSKGTIFTTFTRKYVHIHMHIHTHDFFVSHILPNDQRLSSTHFLSSDLELRFVHTDEYLRCRNMYKESDRSLYHAILYFSTWETDTYFFFSEIKSWVIQSHRLFSHLECSRESKCDYVASYLRLDSIILAMYINKYFHFYNFHLASICTIVKLKTTNEWDKSRSFSVENFLRTSHCRLPPSRTYIYTKSHNTFA